MPTWVVVAALAVASAGCGSNVAPPRATVAPPSTPAPPSRAAAGVGSAGLVGIVMAPATADVAAPLEARLLGVRVRPGDVVRAGDVLAELDTNAPRKELAIADAELRSARAELRRAELDAGDASERAARRAATIVLPSGGVVGTVSREELASARYQAELGSVKVAAARAGVAEKRARREELAMLAAAGAVRAPFDGVVAERFVDEGAMLHKGEPIVRLIGASALRVRFAMPEAEARHVDVGTAIFVDTDGLRLGATVEKVAPEVDAAARLVFAEARLDVPPDERDRVRSGSAARVHLSTHAAP